MTGRTHDLIALTAVNLFAATQPLPTMSVATALVGISATMIGGLIPDIDEPSAKIWEKVPAGSILGRLIHPLIGQHRMVTHSLFGLAVIGLFLPYVLAVIGRYLLVDMHVIWSVVMIGYVSHLLADTITTEGVPWLFPLPYRFGFPPLRSLRIRTGGLVETFLIFPGLIVLNIYLVYSHYQIYLHFVKSLTK